MGGSEPWLDDSHKGTMRVLIACEFSGVVREAFRAKGHDAWSCDLLPAEDNQRYHLQRDVFECLDPVDPWDALIQHWPCTLLCNSGVRWLYEGGIGGLRNEQRFADMEASARNFRRLMDCGIPKIAGENPIPHKYAKAIMGDYSQTIQPWQFGHGETKATCLWLKNLPALKPTNIVEGRTPRVHHASPGPDRWKERSRTLIGVAKAMSEQGG